MGKPPRLLLVAVAVVVVLLSLHTKAAEAAIDEAAELLKGDNETTTSTSTVATVTPATALTNVTSKMPTVFGMRVELPADDPFGYDELGVCSVGPNEKFKIVLYGNHLDKVDKIFFTLSNNCSESTVTIDPVNAFIVHFTHKASFNIILPPVPEGVHAYKMCVKPKGVLTTDVVPLEDISTWLTTEKPPKEYLLPLPVQIGVIVVLLCMSALFSGLTLGLMSLTPQELELVIKSGSKSEKKYAAKILPIRKKGNQLLCALLLGNVIVNAAISILFGELTSGLFALMISSLGIVIFGEIIPQSICVKKGLAVGAHTIAITQFFILITMPIAWPVSKLLDCLLGDEYEGYDRKRLMELMKMSMRENGTLSNELKIAVGAMEIVDKVVEDVMTRIDDVFMLPDTTILNAKTVAEIVRIGYTRIPVYIDGERNNVTDLLIVKDLALLDPDDNFTVRTVCGYHKHPVKFVLNDTPLSVLLEAFKKGDGHLAMVKKLVPGTDSADPTYELVGIVTLEDIVEEIFQAEIVDEFDNVIDNKNKDRRKNKQKSDLTKYFEKEAPHTQVSSHIQMVTLQFLVSNEPAFSEKFINKSVLERLIATSTRRVDMSYLKSTGADINNMAIPKLAKLYTKDELSDRYILILEGRAKVTIGQSGMMFEAGPFHQFGQEILEKLVATANTLSRSTSIIDPGDTGARRPDLMFKPDYSVIITEDCTYLEITIAGFINAYRSSLMLKDREAMALSNSPPISRTSSEESIENLPRSIENLPIQDPDAVLVSERGEHGRASTIMEAKEALEALNAREQAHKLRRPSGEEELGLLKDTQETPT